MLCFRSVPFFVCGVVIFADSFSEWQILGCVLTLEGILLYCGVRGVVEGVEGESGVKEEGNLVLVGGKVGFLCEVFVWQTLVPCRYI